MWRVLTKGVQTAIFFNFSFYFHWNCHSFLFNLIQEASLWDKYCRSYDRLTEECAVGTILRKRLSNFGQQNSSFFLSYQMLFCTNLSHWLVFLIEGI